MIAFEEEFGPRVDVRPVFEQDRDALLTLLHDLEPGEWKRPTAAGPWSVHDVVAHLLGDDMSRLARTRDDHNGDEPGPGEALPMFLDRINDDWVIAARRISPALLIDLLVLTTGQVLQMWRESDLDALGEPVTWASPRPAPVWLDCARDFTEYWVHQQQTRDATDRPGTGSSNVVHAVVDTFLRALPYTLVECAAPEGTTVTIVVDGPAGGTWSVQRAGGRWRWTDPRTDRATTVGLSPDTLWRLCVRGITPDVAGRRVTVVGDSELADAVLQIVSIIR